VQDLVVGYMGVPKYAGVSMMQHPQYITVRYSEYCWRGCILSELYILI